MSKLVPTEYLTSVSYTHLDVYKRQHLDSACTRRRPMGAPLRIMKGK